MRRFPWGLLGTLLAVAALLLRWRRPGSPAAAWAGALLLGLLALRTLALLGLALRGRGPWGRVLLPAVILVEGLGLAWTGSPAFARARIATAGLLELGLLAWALAAWRQGRREADPEHPEDGLARRFEALLPPRAARIVALEVVIMGSAFGSLLEGFRRPRPEGFSYDREAGLPALPVLLVGDALLVHFLVRHATLPVKLLVHGLGVYSIVWVVGLVATMRSRPHRLRAGDLELHLGILKTLRLPRQQVEAVGPVPEFDDDWKRLAYLRGVHALTTAGPAALELKLREPVRVRGFLGAGKALDRVLVSVDDPEAFTKAVLAP